MTNSAAETAGQKLAIDLCDAWCKSKAAPYEKSISIDEMGAFMDGVEAAVTALRAAAGDGTSPALPLQDETECDAEQVIVHYGWPEAKAVEHMWCDHRPPPAPAEAGGDAVRIIKEEWQGYCSRAKECDAYPDAGAQGLIDRLLARFATPTPAADAVRDVLEEILNYSGGAENALQDEYVLERARDALRQKGHHDR